MDSKKREAYLDLVREYAEVKWTYRMELAEYIRMMSDRHQGIAEEPQQFTIEEFLEATHSSPTGLD